MSLKIAVPVSVDVSDLALLQELVAEVREGRRREVVGGGDHAAWGGLFLI